MEITEKMSALKLKARVISLWVPWAWPNWQRESTLRLGLPSGYVFESWPGRTCLRFMREALQGRGRYLPPVWLALPGPRVDVVGCRLWVIKKKKKSHVLVTGLSSMLRLC